MSKESDRLEPQIYDEDSDDEDAVDIEPSTGFETDPALLALIRQAEELVHEADPKLMALIDAWPRPNMFATACAKHFPRWSLKL
jgi:hypothetical protein